MAKLSKRQKTNKDLADKSKLYSLPEGIEVLKKTANTKFKGAVEVHVRLGIDVKKTDQSVRGTAVLPHGTGKTRRIAAFVSEGKEKEAKTAGALIIGGEELVKRIKETEKTDFDIAVAEPSMMKHLAQIAKILGQRGLMPNPKTGTVSENVGKVISEINAGKIEFKNDESGNIHQIIGKTDFEADKLQQNFKIFMDAVNAVKPQALKKQFIIGVTINATMGPAVKVSV